MQHLEEIKNILADILNLGERKNSLNEDSVLLGNIPELDSIAVVNIITALEEYYNISIDDDEINAKTFESLSNLTHFVEQKLSQKLSHC